MNLIFDKNQGHGQIDWAERNVYGNIQLITQMEKIFDSLREQYDVFDEDEPIQDIFYNNMLTLKQKIGHAVQDFFAHIGSHFVSKLNFVNYAYGYRILKFNESRKGPWVKHRLLILPTNKSDLGIPMTAHLIADDNHI